MALRTDWRCAQCFQPGELPMKFLYTPTSGARPTSLMQTATLPVDENRRAQRTSSTLGLLKFSAAPAGFVVGSWRTDGFGNRVGNEPDQRQHPSPAWMRTLLALTGSATTSTLCSLSTPPPTAVSQLLTAPRQV